MAAAGEVPGAGATRSLHRVLLPRRSQHRRSGKLRDGAIRQDARDV